MARVNSGGMARVNSGGDGESKLTERITLIMHVFHEEQ